MKKLIHFFVMLSLLISIGACSKRIDYSGDERFSSIMGHSFSTKSELIIFEIKPSSLPLVAEPGTSDLPKIAEMSTKLPYDYYGRKIVGILPTGSEFQVTKVLRDKSVDSDYFYYEAKIISNGKFNGLLLNTMLLNTSEAIPGFQNGVVQGK